jgi:hypothetical protein
MRRKDGITLTLDEETHIYSCSDGFNYKSVTKTIEDYFEPFNSNRVIRGMMQSSGWNQSSYCGMSAEEIKAQWKAKALLGTQLHTGIEAMIKFSSLDAKLDSDKLISISKKKERYTGIPSWPLGEVETDSLVNEFRLFREFVKTRPFYKYCLSEVGLFSQEMKIAGTADLITYNKSGMCKIYDWKRVVALRTAGRKRGKTIFSDLPDCDASRYSLQLNLYRHLVENYYYVEEKQLRVLEMNLVLLHQENETASIIPVNVDERVALIQN